MQRTDYRFTITRDTDTFIANPNGFFAGNFKYEQTEGQLFFRRKFNGDLTFKGSDFAYFNARYNLGSYCDIYDILIEKKIDGVYQVDWMGYFSMTDGKFDFERCEFTVSPTVNDKYSCILRNWESDVNIFDLGVQSENIFSNAISSIEFQIIPRFDTEMPHLIGMVLWKSRNTLCDYDVAENLDYIYARESLVLTKGIIPIGSGWIKISSEENYYSDFYQFPTLINKASANYEYQNKWVRNWDINYEAYSDGVFVSLLENRHSIQDVLDSCFIGENSSDYNLLASYTFSGDDPDLENTKPIDNRYIKKSYQLEFTTDTVIMYRSFSLTSILTKVLSSICNYDYNIDSPFLLNDTNPVTNASNKVKGIKLIQKSDAKRPQASNPATKGLISFKDIAELLFNLFQLWWFIDGDNIVIKHQSEIENNIGLNIFSAQYTNTTSHKKSIEFNKSILYTYEEWALMESDGIDFKGKPIEYSALCTANFDEKRTKLYSIPTFTSDIRLIQKDSDKVSDNGFAVIVNEANNFINIETGLISNKPQLNGHLSLANLHYNYWRHNRILSSGKMNGIDTEFLSTQKIRKLKEHQIVLCEEFDPLKQVNTEQGEAIVNEATFYPFDSKLTLNMSI